MSSSKGIGIWLEIAKSSCFIYRPPGVCIDHFKDSSNWIYWIPQKRKNRKHCLYYEVKAGVEEISASKMVALNQQGNWTKWEK